MTENLELREMDFDTLSSTCEGYEYLEENGTKKSCISDQTNSKTDSFVVDMERFSHLTNKAVNVTPNSRITLQRGLTRKGSPRGGVKKINSSIIDNKRETSGVATSSSTGVASTPEKTIVVTVGPTDHPIDPLIHHQITITTAAAATPPTERNLSGKRFSFRRSSPSWTIDPRSIFFFCAALSSMGTILVIYFTLSMEKLSIDI